MATNLRLTGADFLAELEEPVKPKKLEYVFREGVRSLSYSRLQTFYSCPRKFHLGELRGAKGFNPTIHTAFGHAYAMGIQTYLHLRSTRSHEVALARSFVSAIAAYDYPGIFEEESASKKSLWFALIGVEAFATQAAPGILEEFEVAVINGKPAIELFFLLQIDEETDYQGHIDLILKHRVTGELFILEIKTKGGDTSPADWANSFQTLGYNAILHTVVPGGTNLNVLYIVYNTKQMTVSTMSFVKSSAHRAEFITSLLLDVNQMREYDKHNYWPKRGGSCTSWGKACHLFGVCDNEYSGMSVPEAYESVPIDNVDFVIHIDQMLEVESTATSETVDWESM